MVRSWCSRSKILQAGNNKRFLYPVFLFIALVLGVFIKFDTTRGLLSNGMDNPTFKIRDIIMEGRETPPVMIEYGIMDIGVYTVCGSIPECKNFCHLNLNLSDEMEVQNKYIEKAENSQNENVKEKVKTKDIAVMTLNLTEGLMDLGENGQSFEDKYAGKSYFPYVTPYSQSNTGFTPAPEVNDRVALYFPSGNETKAFVIGALNNDGNGRFTDVANRNYHVGDSDFNMVLATNSLSTTAASSISQTASNISESADSISESAGNISNNAKSYTEIVEGSKTLVAGNISQTSQGNTSIQSNGDTEVNSNGFSVVNGGSNVLING